MSTAPRFLVTFLAISSAQTWAAATAELTKEQTDFFENKIRPILTDKCYKCHSVESGKSKGNLTLDTRPGVLKGGDAGPAVVAGSPEKSPLYTALTYEDKDLQMPPSSSGGKLSGTQIADIATWIKMGAPDPRTEAAKTKRSGLTASARSHWAFQEPGRYAIPNNKNQQWCRTPIDAFILQKLEANGMLPSPDAERETLLRRVSFDLTGLPPTYAETEAFMNDTSANAYEKVVDRLLASPAYGERWARHWLDTARYADTVGGPRNATRNKQYRYADAWTYRDYVVRSFNEDKPYTDFIIEQLAADKIPGIQPDDSRLAALGFLTVGERFPNANDVINDRIDVMSKGFLGLTVTCARCHDHMFDPIPTRDYYALHGVFSSITEPDQKPLIGMKVTSQQRQDFEKKYAALVKQLGSQYLDIVGTQLNEFYRDSGAYIRAALAGGGKGGKANTEQKDMIDNYKLDRELVQFLARGIQQNPSVWGPLMAFRNGGSKFKKMTATEAMAMAQKLEAKVAEKGGDKDGKMAKAMSERLQAGANPLVERALAARQPKTFDEALEVYAGLFASMAPRGKALVPAMKSAVSQSVPGWDSATIDLLRGPFEVVPLPMLTQEIIENAAQGLPQKLAGRGRMNTGDINLLEISHPGAPARAMVVEDKARPVNSPIFIRGQAQTKGAIVPRGFLEILSPDRKPVPFTEGSGRMELAKCIASRDNPLTARVIVNRVWMHHFGEGFVASPDDLGTMSEKPTHPELFDSLVNWFMDNGWSLKKLHKYIVTSRIYQESSHTRPEYEAIDPGNRLIWRANVRRLEFEAMRDSLLVYSGYLDRTVGGKPVNLTDEPYSNRRSVYGYIDRGNLPELMSQFDFSDPDMPNSKRATSIVPQQALFLMNSSMAVDVARKILTRPEVAGKTGEFYKISAIYRVIFQRYPKPEEMQMGMRFLQTEARNQGEAVAAIDAKVASAGKSKNGGGKGRGDSKYAAIQNEGTTVTRKVLTPWETYVHALLFSNEAAYLN